MNERVRKAAIEYIANEYSANMQMLECNPRTAITIAECQRLMVGFSEQQGRIKEQTKMKDIEDSEIWNTGKVHKCEYFLAEGATVFVCECGKLEVGGTIFYSEEELAFQIDRLIDTVIEMAESKTTIIVPMSDFIKELQALKATHK